jgi:hypothetical protein
MHGVGVTQALDFHNKVDDAAALAAAEAMIDLLFDIDRKGRRLFAVKRAEPKQVVPGFSGQADVPADNVGDIVFLTSSSRNAAGKAIRTVPFIRISA